MNTDDAKTLARLRRNDQLAALRDGRRNRSVRIEPKTRYGRRGEHRARQWTD